MTANRNTEPPEKPKQPPGGSEAPPNQQADKDRADRLRRIEEERRERELQSLRGLHKVR